MALLALGITAPLATAQTVKDLLAQSNSASDLLRSPPTSANSAPGRSSRDGADLDILDEVTVTATRRPTRARDTTAVTYTVQREDFASLGAVTVTDALRLVPGFEAAPSLSGTRNFGLNFLRGFSDQRFQVLRDGVSIQRPDNGSSDLARFDIEDLERIEVLTGGTTLRYGTGAVGGVINLITETPKGPPKLTLSYQAGSYGFAKYVGKYGGGDDTLSYNLVFSSVVSPNNYPFRLSIPSSALFYGPTDVVNNPGCPAASLFCANGGLPNGTPLYGLLRPEVGPPQSVSGTADVAYSAYDSFSAKLVFRPDPANRITLRLGQQNSKNAFVSPGLYSFGYCQGGPAGIFGNGTVSGNRILPVDRSGRELPCDTQRFTFKTLTNVFANRLAYNASADGSVQVPPGQAYLSQIEPLTGNQDFFQQSTQTQTEVALFWDYDMTPTTSLNSYLQFFRLTQAVFQANPYLFNTNLFGTTPPGQPAALPLPPAAFPFADARGLEAQSAATWRISPGQVLNLGINYNEYRSYTDLQQEGTFVDRAISRTSLFLVNDLSFDDQWKANLGLRYTYSTQYGSILTSAAGLRYSPTSWLSVRGNFSQIFNSPPIDQLFNFTSLSAPFLSNPNLLPETGITYDVGLDVTPAPNVGLRLTYFSSYLDGVIGNEGFANTNPVTRLAFPTILRAVNLDSQYASGVEFSGDWQIDDRFRFRVAWTNTDSRPYGRTDSPEESTYPYYYGYQSPGVPFNRVVTQILYLNQGWSVSLTGSYDSGKRRAAIGGYLPRGDQGFLPATATLDLNVEVPITSNFTITGSVFNLTDTQYEYLSGVPAPGTTFRVGARLELGGG